jgi:hypothetical protein
VQKLPYIIAQEWHSNLYNRFFELDLHRDSLAVFLAQVRDAPLLETREVRSFNPKSKAKSGVV